jgi:uncharacterized protein (UPF0264 family)
MSAARPRLLVSVRNSHEAEEALAGGADWIDLKEPRRGALGAVDAATAREVVAKVNGRAQVSAAAGEVLAWRGSSAVDLLGVPGVSLLKLGLAGCRGAEWRSVWRLALDQTAAAGKDLVSVIYADAVAADAPPPGEQLAAAVEAPSQWILWDTFDKSGDVLIDVLPRAALAAQLATARSAAKQTVVAGRLSAKTIPQLPLELIDMIAVRSAACDGSRNAAVRRGRVAALREVIARHADCYVV